ncbi:MAG: hypothetical protein NC831_08945 [Candidatus Omnitrophica bacterium]|nr:hypothetical protein [Candidatus Omnitrophota bacterium]
MKVLLVEPQKSRRYHTQYPPLGLLKLAAYHKKRKDKVKFVRGFDDNGFYPDKIYITSLFTYAWYPVHEAIRYYSKKYKKAEIVVGGIYATLCEEHLKKTFKDRIRIHKGICEEVENILPDYSLVPEWNASIIFASRGCIRNCPFCSVKILEPEFKPKKTIKHLIHPGHKKIILWDNNVLASPYWEDIFQELQESKLEIDFNQGIDARLINLKVVEHLKRLKISIIRLAYDIQGIKKYLEHAISLLKEAGFNGRQILVYCLYNNPFEKDTPETFLSRIQDLIDWGVVSYPMRYEPLEPRQKNTYVSPYWTQEQLEMVAKARRVLGYGGAFPPYEGLRKKFLNAKTFEQAFELNPPCK